MAFQRVDVGGPQAPEVREPFVDFLEWPRPDPVDATLGIHSGFDESGVAKDPKVLGNRGLGLATLLAVSRLSREAYGLNIRRDLTERMGREYAVGAIYTTLQRLETKGLLASHASDPIPVRGGRSRRHYRLTGAGSRALRD